MVEFWLASLQDFLWFTKSIALLKVEVEAESIPLVFGWRTCAESSAAKKDNFNGFK